jgi:hypothetical protein
MHSFHHKAGNKDGIAQTTAQRTWETDCFPFPMTWEVSELGDRNGYTYTSIYNAKFHLNNTGHLKAPVWLYFSLVPEFNLEALS